MGDKFVILRSANNLIGVLVKQLIEPYRRSSLADDKKASAYRTSSEALTGARKGAGHDGRTLSCQSGA